MLTIKEISSLMERLTKYNERLRRDTEGGTESIGDMVIIHSILGSYMELNENNRLMKRLGELLKIANDENVIQEDKEVKKVDLEDKKFVEKRDAELINLILDFAVKNYMSMQEIDNCIDKVERVYYSDGLITRE